MGFGSETICVNVFRLASITAFMMVNFGCNGFACNNEVSERYQRVSRDTLSRTDSRRELENGIFFEHLAELSEKNGPPPWYHPISATIPTFQMVPIEPFPCRVLIDQNGNGKFEAEEEYITQREIGFERMVIRRYKVDNGKRSLLGTTTSSVELNAEGHPIKKVAMVEPQGEELTETYEYDAYGRRSQSQLDVMTSEYTYDEKGRIVSVVTSQQGNEDWLTLKTLSYEDDGQRVNELRQARAPYIKDRVTSFYYDEHLVLQLQVIESGERRDTMRVYYEYDGLNKPMKAVTKVDDEIISMRKWDYDCNK